MQKKKNFNNIHELVYELMTDNAQKFHKLYQYLIKMKYTIVDPLIQILLKRGNPKIVRCRAAYVLGKIRDIRAFEALLKIAQDRNEHKDIRYDAIIALGDLGDVRAIPLLLQFVQRVNSPFCNPAAMALKRIGSPSIQSLVKLLNHANPEVRAVVVRILGGISKYHVIRLLEEKVKDEDENVRIAVAESLAELFEKNKYPRAADILKLMLNDSSQRVRKIVKYWLKELRIDK